MKWRYNMEYKSLTTPAAEGGTVTTTATHRIHTFTSSGIFTVNKSMNVEALVVAGGGGNGTGVTGGGGAGGLIYNSSFPVLQQLYSVVVGNGGVGDQKGFNSTFSTLDAVGGGQGGGGGSDNNGRNGGSGGGGSTDNLHSSASGGAGSAGQGYAGGSVSGTRSGGGGGGAGAAGGLVPLIPVLLAEMDYHIIFLGQLLIMLVAVEVVDFILAALVEWVAAVLVELVSLIMLARMVQQIQVEVLAEAGLI